ncbi:hypothetical protein JKF63_05698 [Porcisia hertigi]|uniref:Uncharacterized protein n=1 Tax=Porcisia hertigi TaxID=2761500 RepID=A0A836LHS6_9TRYP|nr:hypothetical protein JKF63_05698 [Porcisia hertigi]
MGHAISRKNPRGRRVGVTTHAVQAVSPIHKMGDAEMNVGVENELQRVDSSHGLTQEMIEELACSGGGVSSKAKCNTLKWIAMASYVVRHSPDALKMHEESMRALTAMQAAKHGLLSSSKVDAGRISMPRSSKREGVLEICRPCF